MYVRWKIKSRAADLNAGISTPVSLYTAYLVESTRIDGKPRQKTIAYLGSIKDKRIQYVTHQHYFWQRVENALQGLDLSPEQRESIEVKLLARVPRPNEEAYAKEMAALTHQMRVIDARLKM